MTSRDNDASVNNLADTVRALVKELSLDGTADTPVEVRQAIALARHLQRRANALQTPQEKRQQAELDRMIQNPRDKVTLTQMTDQSFRSNTPHRAADQLVHILDVQGVPRFFTPFDRALLKGFQSFGAFLPGVAVPLVKDKMQHETANVVLPAEQDLLVQHLNNRRSQGVRMNVNYLGEALLGEEEAAERLQNYLTALQIPEIEVISVKISTIYSQISTLARRQTIATLSDRLQLLYQSAAKATFTRHGGEVVPKFVYLDMEESRDMRLTADAFMQTLNRPGLLDTKAGIVLQSYLPDSYRIQRQILKWARQRVTKGGAPITLRIVKGANREMERFEASVRGWPQAPYREKAQTDANFRRMVQFSMRPENLNAAKLGIASHNLFEMAYGLILAIKRDAMADVQFEMLEGMASHQRRALFELSKNLLLYAPACKKEDFIHAIGYLVRRLDENTGPDNFLRHAFRLEVDSPDWQRLEQQFRQAFDRLPDLSDAPRRTQDRNQLPLPPDTAGQHWQNFTNEPDTDFSLLQNCQWAESIIADWKDRHSDRAADIPLVVAGQEILDDRPRCRCLDPSRPETVIGRYRKATPRDIERAIACAREDPAGWRDSPASDRRTVLRDVAQEVRRRRGDLMGAALADGGKVLSESDSEVSEAIDFLEFYCQTAEYFEQLPGLSASGRGVVAVVSPWNFPIAIPCGGIAAALAAGNQVILKPASDAVRVAYLLCQCFWDAGVSRRTLQFLPCEGAMGGQQLVDHSDVDAVILTGGTETARSMLARRPKLHLLAETGGKNATIVTALADRDQAIKHVVQSAFGHSGQKCSATSLLILEAEVFEDTRFKAALCDAVSSLPVGSAWDLKTKVGPLIRPPTGVLERALKKLEPGESWAVMPCGDRRNPNLYSPAVKWSVQPGSFTHNTEFFGPVLAVMKAANLHEAIHLVNATGFGLTSGLESLDDREHQLWRRQIRAGNLYVNRGTTGAIVLRQPFGGMGKSAFGPGIQTGGPNYVAQLMHFEDSQPLEGSPTISDSLLAELANRITACDSTLVSTEEKERILAAMHSYTLEMQREFGQQHDHFRLVGQDNLRHYLPIGQLRIRVHPSDSGFDILARVAAAKTIGSRITLSHPPMNEATVRAQQVVQWLDEATEEWAAAIEFVEETDQQLAEVIRQKETECVRFAATDRAAKIVRAAAVETGLYLADAPVRGNGRIELLWYVQEQSISNNYHRYGNLGDRSDQPRATVT